MNFLQPWVLWALPAILLPIAIHLIHRRRHRVVEWGAMMFLLEGAKMSKGAQRLRHFLLLLFRTLAVVGLVLGLGRPIAGGHFVHIACGQKIAANRPIAFSDFVDPDPSDRAHGLAFDLDHRLSDTANHVLLLGWGENVFDDINGYEWHLSLLFYRGSPIIRLPMGGF